VRSQKNSKHRSLFWRYNVFASRTFGPHTLGTIVFLVFDQKPRFGDTFAAVRAVTERRFIGVHAKGWKERVTVCSFHSYLWRPRM
jgi:hypothetical protein